MNELEQRIHKEIAEKGGIPFSRFMELALYEPGLGYYETQKEVGLGGDFFTSVSVGRVYGELLAFQIADWLEGIDGRVQLVEAGAHARREAYIKNSRRVRLKPGWILGPSVAQLSMIC